MVVRPGIQPRSDDDAAVPATPRRSPRPNGVYWLLARDGHGAHSPCALRQRGPAAAGSAAARRRAVQSDDLSDIPFAATHGGRLPARDSLNKTRAQGPHAKATTPGTRGANLTIDSRPRVDAYLAILVRAWKSRWRTMTTVAAAMRALSGGSPTALPHHRASQ